MDLESPGPFAIETIRPVLSPKGDVTNKEVSPTFYEELNADFGGFGGHALISKHDFDAPWGSWEMHPKGDEIVYLISGDVEFVLWDGNEETTVHVSEPGSYIVVPKGAWHTANRLKPTSMFFVTPGEGTEISEDPRGI